MKGKNLDECDGPIPGPTTSRQAAMTSTTGEVNLYPDPGTFGTSTPQFYADCEGFQGVHPLAARHQLQWFSKGRQYLVETSDGQSMDRKKAVQSIYPKFLYLFSDVICIVSRNLRSRTQIAIQLLEWSEAGAKHTVNQGSLPAAVIIINAPPYESDKWVSEDLDAMTDDFFCQIDVELEENNDLRKKAEEVLISTGFRLTGNFFTLTMCHNRKELKR
jgi:hypothetical protein